MPSERPLDEFQRRNGTTLAILDQARPLLNDSYDTAWPALAEFRKRLATEMHEFQVYKHSEIFDPIVASDRADRSIAEALKADCIKLGNEYHTFRQTWEKADAYSRWSEYCLSAILMMTRIRKRLAEQGAIVRKLAPLQSQAVVVPMPGASETLAPV